MNASRQYPDTAAGAIQCLRDGSDLDVSRATAACDPAVDGVWMVVHPGNDGAERSIVYLMGYKDPWGRARRSNDWETEG